MDMTGEFRIPAPRQRVWEGLNDPEILKQCIPGCEAIEKVSDTEFAARAVARVGPVRASFAGKVTLSDLDPPRSYMISGEGQGGVAGFAKGSARVRLDEEASETTLLKYEVDAHVGGKLAQIGSRLIDATSRKMASDFFERFAALMAPGVERAPDMAASETAGTEPAATEKRPVEAVVAATTPAPLEAQPPSSTPPPAAAPGVERAAEEPAPQNRPPAPAAPFRLPPAIWVTGLAVVVALMLYYFTRHGGG
jgi:uncharacterized protein